MLGREVRIKVCCRYRQRYCGLEACNFLTAPVHPETLEGCKNSYATMATSFPTSYARSRAERTNQRPSQRANEGTSVGLGTPFGVSSIQLSALIRTSMRGLVVRSDSPSNAALNVQQFTDCHCRVLRTGNDLFQQARIAPPVTYSVGGAGACTLCIGAFPGCMQCKALRLMYTSKGSSVQKHCLGAWSYMASTSNHLSWNNN
jgi:hypothetical protein